MHGNSLDSASWRLRFRMTAHDAVVTPPRSADFSNGQRVARSAPRGFAGSHRRKTTCAVRPHRSRSHRGLRSHVAVLITAALRLADARRQPELSSRNSWQDTGERWVPADIMRQRTVRFAASGALRGLATTNRAAMQSVCTAPLRHLDSLSICRCVTTKDRDTNETDACPR